jgi:hypothetical protein
MAQVSAASSLSSTTRTEPLPRSAPGKLLKNRLRDPFWAGHDRRVN